MLALLCFNSLGFSQILIGEPQPEPARTNKKDKKSDSDTLKAKKEPSGTSLYFITNWSATNRSLTVNGDLFGDSLGERAKETGLNTWSFGLGFQNQLSKHLLWDGGISFLSNGESYSFVATDTAYSYQTSYSYISMPVRLNYTVGNDFKFYAGAGLIPQMFMGYKQERQWTRADNSDETETIKAKNGYNSFVISAVMNVGMMVNFNNGWSLLVSPEARFQLNSSYMDQDAYIHKGRAYGVTFGLVRHL
ncbi:MAG: hypothetical protein RI922_2884 [Bacteroidota bacterium]|jgi:hypothetical protein